MRSRESLQKRRIKVNKADISECTEDGICNGSWPFLWFPLTDDIPNRLYYIHIFVVFIYFSVIDMLNRLQRNHISCLVENTVVSSWIIFLFLFFCFVSSYEFWLVGKPRTSCCSISQGQYIDLCFLASCSRTEQSERELDVVHLYT